MSTKLLGDTFDIHGGGLDLIFPHHENEIAQARALGKPFARWWLHHGMMTVSGEKISKSTGNVVTVDGALGQCDGEVDVLKVFFLGTHYRSPIDYTVANLTAAKKRFRGWFHLSYFAQARGMVADKPQTVPTEIATLKQEFEDAMETDLNTPGALAALDKLANLSYKWEVQATTGGTADEPEARKFRGKMLVAVETIHTLGQRLGLFSRWDDPIKLPAEGEALIQRREEARKRKDFVAADRMRKEFLEKTGILIEDTPDGPMLIRKR